MGVAGASGAGLALLAAGCGGGPSGSSSPSASSGGAAEGPLASSQVLKVRYYDDPGGFDPANLFRIEVENIAFNVYSGLTTYEPEHGKLIPDLAESWETPDPTT